MLRNGLAAKLAQSPFIIRLDQAAKPRKIQGWQGPVFLCKDRNLFAVRRDNILVTRQEFFILFLSWSQTRKHNLYIFVRNQS